MIAQYHNDVAEIKRLEKVLKECKDPKVGCTEAQIKAKGDSFKDITGGSDNVNRKAVL